VQKAIEEQLNAGIIRKSKSEWSSALRVVHKPDGSVRITVDYKPLNKIIVGDEYPLPHISELYKRLSESDVFSKIDLKAAYHQIPMDPDSIKYTAFTCPFGLYEYLCMPMGLKHSPSHFQRFMESTFKEFIDKKVLEIYLDDTILHTIGLQQHKEELLNLFKVIEKHGIKCSYDKSQLVVDKIAFLGNSISKNQIKPNPDRAKCLINRPKPTNLQELQGWLGVANYLRPYIEHYARITQPLYEIMNIKNVPKTLRKKNGAPNGKLVKIEWNDEANKQFEVMKKTICSDLVLSLPDYDREMLLSTDASEKGYGAALEQNFKIRESDPDLIKPLEFFSKNYTPAQKKYSTSEKELLAIVMAVEFFHPFLYGKRFTIYTDHLPLTFLMNKKNPHPRLERWILRLSLYDFIIKFRPGKKNIVADFLSRLNDEDDTNPNQDDDYHDQLVASVEIQNKTFTSELEKYKDTCEYNINLIAMNPSSESIHEYNGYKNEQEKDDDIQWIKKLIIENEDCKPTITKFNNQIQRQLYREYDNLIIVEDIVYRETEDRSGFKCTQFLLPKQILIEVIRYIHQFTVVI
jgi:hypothetical protein